MAYEPKEQVNLNPPKSDPFTRKKLLKYDGIQDEKIYVGIKGQIFDVTQNKKAYGPGTSYHVFTGKDSSRALAKSSLSPEDNNSSISYKIDDLTEDELRVLEDWYTFFSKRYNIVGVVVEDDKTDD